MANYVIDWPADTKVGMIPGKWHESAFGFLAEYSTEELEAAIEVERRRREAAAEAALNAWYALPAQFGDTKGRHPQAWLKAAQDWLAQNPQHRDANEVRSRVAQFKAAERGAWSSVETALAALEAAL